MNFAEISFFRRSLLFLFPLCALFIFPPSLRAEEKGLDVIVLIDDSGSMIDTDRDQIRYAAAQILTTYLRDSDRLGFIRFTDRIEESQAPESSKSNSAREKFSALLKRNSLEIQGETDILLALNECLKIVKENQRDRQTVVFLLTDGLMNPSAGRYPEWDRLSHAEKETYQTQYWPGWDKYVDATVTEFSKRNLPINGIALTTEADSPFLWRLCSGTQGDFLPPTVSKRAADLVDFFLNIFRAYMSERIKSGDLPNHWKIDVGENENLTDVCFAVEGRGAPPAASVVLREDRPNGATAAFTFCQWKVQSLGDRFFGVARLVQPASTLFRVEGLPPGVQKEWVTYGIDVETRVYVSLKEDPGKGMAVQVRTVFVDRNGRQVQDKNFYQNILAVKATFLETARFWNSTRTFVANAQPQELAVVDLRQPKGALDYLGEFRPWQPCYMRVTVDVNFADGFKSIPSQEILQIMPFTLSARWDKSVNVDFVRPRRRLDAKFMVSIHPVLESGEPHLNTEYSCVTDRSGVIASSGTVLVRPEDIKIQPRSANLNYPSDPALNGTVSLEAGRSPGGGKLTLWLYAPLCLPAKLEKQIQVGEIPQVKNFALDQTRANTGSAVSLSLEIDGDMPEGAALTAQASRQGAPAAEKPESIPLQNPAAGTFTGVWTPTRPGVYSIGLEGLPDIVFEKPKITVLQSNFALQGQLLPPPLGKDEEWKSDFFTLSGKDVLTDKTFRCELHVDGDYRADKMSGSQGPVWIVRSKIMDCLQFWYVDETGRKTGAITLTPSAPAMKFQIVMRCLNPLSGNTAIQLKPRLDDEPIMIPAPQPVTGKPYVKGFAVAPQWTNPEGVVKFSVKFDKPLTGIEKPVVAVSPAGAAEPAKQITLAVRGDSCEGTWKAETPGNYACAVAGEGLDLSTPSTASVQIRAPEFHVDRTFSPPQLGEGEKWESETFTVGAKNVALEQDLDFVVEAAAQYTAARDASGTWLISGADGSPCLQLSLENERRQNISSVSISPAGEQARFRIAVKCLARIDPSARISVEPKLGRDISLGSAVMQGKSALVQFSALPDKLNPGWKEPILLKVVLDRPSEADFVECNVVSTGAKEVEYLKRVQLHRMADGKTYEAQYLEYPAESTTLKFTLSLPKDTLERLPFETSQSVEIIKPVIEIVPASAYIGRLRKGRTKFAIATISAQGLLRPGQFECKLNYPKKGVDIAINQEGPFELGPAPNNTKEIQVEVTLRKLFSVSFWRRAKATIEVSSAQLGLQQELLITFKNFWPIIDP